ncbi:MAG: hypothetical protein HYX68_27305 [Planctomycetes bacterium]|nr:hypothetical protein [Planctomycetota bacterium]
MNTSAESFPREIDITDKRYDSTVGLYEDVAGVSARWQGKLTIMAGHYMLIYDRNRKKLIPFLASELKGETGFSGSEPATFKEDVGDFPEASFELGLKLVANRPSQESRIALLVNDHQFQTFQEHLPKGAALAQLKQRYYREHPGLPESLRQLAEPYGPQDALLEPNHSKRSKDTLPSRTFFFSENSLQNRFKDHRRPSLINLPGFRYVRSPAYGPAPRLLFQLSTRADPLCLVDEREGCACSGIMLELLLILAERGTRHVILFIPYVCKYPVRSSIEAMMSSSLTPFANVIAAWGDQPDESGKVRFLTTTSYALRGAAGPVRTN